MEYKPLPRNMKSYLLLVLAAATTWRSSRFTQVFPRYVVGDGLGLGDGETVGVGVTEGDGVADGETDGLGDQLTDGLTGGEYGVTVSVTVLVGPGDVTGAAVPGNMA